MLGLSQAVFVDNNSTDESYTLWGTKSPSGYNKI